MTNPDRTVGVTVAEVAMIVSKLERRPVSVAQVRSMLVLDTRGRAIAPRRHGQTRLYSVVDVALVRLTLRLRQEGVSPTVARVVVACWQDALDTHWTLDDPMALAVIGVRGLLLYAMKSKPAGAVAWIELRDIWRGVPAAVRAVRKAEPSVWQWKSQPAAAIGTGA